MADKDQGKSGTSSEKGPYLRDGYLTGPAKRVMEQKRKGKKRSGKKR